MAGILGQSYAQPAQQSPNDYLTQAIASGLGYLPAYRGNERAAYQQAKKFTGLADWTPLGIPEAAYQAGGLLGVGARDRSPGGLLAGAGMTALAAMPIAGKAAPLVKKATERVKAYHGTADTFDEFDNAMAGKITGASSARSAHWAVDHLPTAKAYSVYAAEDGPINKLIREQQVLERAAQKSGKASDWDKVDQVTAQLEEIDTYAARHQRRTERAHVKDVFIDGDLHHVDAGGKSPQELSQDENIDSWLQAQLDEARKLGKAGVKITNLDDAVGLYNQPATHYGIFDAKNIKIKPK